MPPLVSVIVPVFDDERRIGEALESVWAQDYEELEVLVIDDASSDGSREVIATHRTIRPNLVLLQNEQNRGPAAARNAGLAAAGGDLITFLDADDLMTEGRLQFQVQYLAEHPDVDVVVGTERIELEDGVDLPTWLDGRNDGRPLYYQMSMMARTPVFERVGGFDETFRVSSDTEWMYRAAAVQVETALVDRVLLTRRIHGGNITFQTEEIRRATKRALLKTARAQLRRRHES